MQIQVSRSQELPSRSRRRGRNLIPAPKPSVLWRTALSQRLRSTPGETCQSIQTSGNFCPTAGNLLHHVDACFVLFFPREEGRPGSHKPLRPFAFLRWPSRSRFSLTHSLTCTYSRVLDARPDTRTDAKSNGTLWIWFSWERAAHSSSGNCSSFRSE